LPEFRPKEHPTASYNLFGLLELGIWKLFVIWNLMFGIFSIQRLDYNLSIQFDNLNAIVSHDKT